VSVTVTFRGGTQRLTINQQKAPPIDGLFVSVGSFEFSDEAPGSVEFSNAGTDGHVIIDAVQWLPAGQ